MVDPTYHTLGMASALLAHYVPAPLNETNCCSITFSNFTTQYPRLTAGFPRYASGRKSKSYSNVTAVICCQQHGEFVACIENSPKLGSDFGAE